MFVGIPITTSPIYANNDHYKPILVIGGNDGVEGYVCLWQMQNFDFNERHGKIVNKVDRPYLKDLLMYGNQIIELDDN
jgi:mRNA interferase MazF